MAGGSGRERVCSSKSCLCRMAAGAGPERSPELREPEDAGGRAGGRPGPAGAGMAAGAGSSAPGEGPRQQEDGGRGCAGKRERRGWIRGLQIKLVKCAVLKNQEDGENFWMLIPQGCHSSQLKEKPEDIKSKMFASKSLPSCAFVRTSTEQPAVVSLSQRCGQLKNLPARVWGSACCQHPPCRHKHTKPQKETEQIFPKLQLSGPSELPKRPEELLQTGEEYRTSKRSKKYFEHERRLFYLHHMYHLAFLNMALSRRRLEQNNQFAAVENAHSVHDLARYLFPREHKPPGTTEKKIEENTFPVLARKKQQGQHCKRSSKACKVFSELGNEDNGVTEIPEHRKSSASALAPQETNPVPLTLQEVALKHPVLEGNLEHLKSH
ncbi:uncharacterized protein LJ206_006787 [Theristicus caerulescens]